MRLSIHRRIRTVATNGTAGDRPVGRASVNTPLILGMAGVWLAGILPSLVGAGETASEPTTPVVNVTVYPLAYATDSDGKPFGICHDIPIQVGGGAPGEIRVGIIETEISGAGDQWRAAAWQSTLTAAQLLDFHPQTTQAAFTVRGRIDGPSAGALLTIGVLSAVRGDTLRDDITMTGTINPDGMIGPVGGIPWKIEGAARAGRTTVLIPVHDRFEWDATTKQPIDLVKHGNDLGVTVIPVNDIWTAYEKFTGQTLPRPEPADLPSVAPEVSQHVTDRISVWTELYQNGRDKYTSWPAHGHTEYADTLMAEADEFRKRVDRLRSEGQFAAAYWDAVWAATVSWAAHEIGRYQYTWHLKGERDAYGLIFDDDWLTQRIDTTAAAMRFFRPRTLEQLAVYMEACDAFFEGLGYSALADVLRNNLPNDRDVAADWLAAIAEQHALSWVYMKLARELLELADRYDGTPLPSDLPIEELTEFYLRCGDSGMAMVNALEVNSLAKHFRVGEESAAAELGLRDPAYAIAGFTIKRLVPMLPRYFGDGDQLSFARLAAARSLHARTAMLLAKYYSLGVELDSSYNIVGIRRERAVNEWLDDSEEQARRAIGSLKKAGIDSSTCVQIYSVARIYEGRGLEDRVESLEYYFATNVTAQILRRLAAAANPDPAGQVPAPPQ